VRQRLPNLDYRGQTTQELLACKDSHSATSLVFAFEWGIQAKGRQLGEKALTDEERVVLALRALDREVNNGGFHQFFWNSSRKFAPIVVPSLQRVGCPAVAALTERAIAILQPKALTVESFEEAILQEHAERDAAFNVLDKEFYNLAPVVDHLLEFIVEHQDRIQLIRTDDYPRFPAKKELSNASKLEVHLRFWKKGWTPSLEEARQTAAEIARNVHIPATDVEIEGAAVLYVFSRAIRSGDLALGESLAPRAFELRNEDPTHVIVYRDWVQLLLKSECPDSADAAELAYLEYINGWDQADPRTKKCLTFLGPLLRDNREDLPKSVAFFIANFPTVDLDNLPPPLQFFKGGRVPGTGPRTAS
jgi:hypothetical protein